MRKLSSEGWWLLALLAVALVAVTRPSIHGNDGVQNYVYLRSLVFDGDLDFTNEYAHYYAQAPQWFDEKQIPRDAVTGLPINLYGVGNAVLWAPWVLAFHAGGLMARACGLPVALDGYSRLYEWAVSLGSAFYASAGVLLVFCLLCRWVAPRAAFWAALLTWLGSPLFFYSHIHASMSHANSFFLSSLLAFAFWSMRNSWRKGAAMGLVAGLLVLTRFQDGILLVPLGAVETARAVRIARRRLACRRCVAWCARRAQMWGIFALVFALTCSPQLAAWHVLHGSAFSGPQGYLSQGRVNLLWPRHLLAACFSPFHGLFHWHPILLLAVAGLCLGRLPRRVRLFAWCGFLSQAWVIGSWSIWWAGASFGQRMFISVFPHLALGFGALFDSWLKRARWLVPALICVAVAWNFGLVVQYATRMIPRQAPVSLVTLGSNMVRVPQALFKRPAAQPDSPAAPQGAD